MKFLCVPCDEPMRLNRTVGPDQGSMTIVYRCPLCNRETAMLTNAMETQMVRGLDIKIGGRSVPREPMEFVRDTLAGSRLSTTGTSGASTNSGQAGVDAAAAPYGDGAGLSSAAAEPGGSVPIAVKSAAGRSDGKAPTAPATGKCPFTHAVNEAFAAAESDTQAPASQVGQSPVATAQTNPSHPEPPPAPSPISVASASGSSTGAPPVWTPEATARMERVPSYIRPMVRKGVEEFARAEGLTSIDATLMDELKGRFGGM